MREIKFRAWDSEKEVMAEVVRLDEEDVTMTDGALTYWDSVRDYIAVVMQYTGLKDKNGTEIYEGDVVQIKGHPFEGHIKIDGNYEVYYNENMELCYGNFLLHRELPYVTVIGNKFENPELLNN